MKHRAPITIAAAAALCLGSASLSGAQTNAGQNLIPPPGNIPGPGFVPGTGFNGGGFFPGGFQTANQAFGAFGGGFSPFGAQMSAFNPFNSLMAFNGQAGSGAGFSFTRGVNQENGAFAGRNGGFYGGYYGFSDPAFTVTPNGLVPMDYGYGGYPGTGGPAQSDWDVLRSTYNQGYQDALDAAAAQANGEGNADTNATGMTATPRNTVRAVPHGSDDVKMWRIGRSSQIALRWQGDPRVAASVTFSVTDRSGRTLRSTTVNQLPAEVRFTPPANAVYYQALVHYVDGKTNTIMGKLPQ